MFLKKITTAVAISIAATAAAQAAGHSNCGIDAGRVNIVGNEFPAIQTVGAGAVGMCKRQR
jgi:hypothetical protein